MAVAGRIGRLRGFRLPGGDRAARDPRLSALGLLWEADRAAAKVKARQWYEKSAADSLLLMLESGRHCVTTGSVGRLFEGVSALLGVVKTVSFEGEAAMALENLAWDADPELAPYELPVSLETPAVGDFEPLLDGVLRDQERGVGLCAIARRFHQALVGFGVELALGHAHRDVVLGGGCFQNQLLSLGLKKALTARGYRVFVPERVPSGDGGLALGQAYAAPHLVGARSSCA